MSTPVNNTRKKKRKNKKAIQESNSGGDSVDLLIKTLTDQYCNLVEHKISASQDQKKLIGYYSKGYAELFGSWIWKTEDGKEVTITEVCEEGKHPLTVGCFISYVGPVKQFIKRVCPTGIDKEVNCLCKCNSDVFTIVNKQLTLKDQGF